MITIQTVVGDDYDLKVIETYCIASSVEDTIPPHSVQLMSLSVAQETLLSLLERHVQLKTQAETHASSYSRPESLKTLREWRTQQLTRSLIAGS